INKLKAEIAEKNKQIDNILKNFAFASQAVIKRMNVEVDKLTEEIANLNRQIYKLEAVKNNQKQLDTDAIETIFKMWDKVSKEDKQKIVDILITKVLVSKEKIEIIWKI
ncbi:MAG TPA: hypothetical protein PK767_06570, partial [Clostridiales bacterium]|nr:hypothetical protein [Clostridiales bacterium]